MFSPEGTREAIQKHFSRRYCTLKSRGEDPSRAIFEVIRLSYKINKIPFTEASLAYDVIPFTFMTFNDINLYLPDYLMYQTPYEVTRNYVDINALANAINESFINPSCATNPNAKHIVSDNESMVDMLTMAEKYQVFWFHLLDDKTIWKFIYSSSIENKQQKSTLNNDESLYEDESRLDVNKFIEHLDLHGTPSKVIYALISNTLSILGRMPSSSFTPSDDCHLFLLGYIFGYSFKYSLIYNDPATQEQMCWLTFGAVLAKIYGKATQLTKDSFNRVLDIVCSRKYPTYFECGTNAGENDAIDFLLNIENANRNKKTGIRNLYHFYKN